MFQSESHLPQILPPSAYTDSQVFGTEVERLFLPAWHCVGTTDDLKKEGDYLTALVLKRPIIVWRSRGELHAFINTCAHRYSQLTDSACGNMMPLRCQYHGWEFNEAGDTQRIPDARCFRPLESGQLGLAKLPLETCGKIVLVHLGQSPRSIQDQFGFALQKCSDFFHPESRCIYRTSHTVPANWKLVVENAIESYHVGCVHAASFAAMPPAETCSHEISEPCSSFVTTAPSQAPAWLRRIERLLHRMMRIPHTERYEHVLAYPNTLMSRSKMVSVAMVARPISVDQTEFLWWVFIDKGAPTLRARLARKLVGYWAIKEVNKVLAEDFTLLPSVQRGISSPLLPSGGIISSREERVFHFQSWLRDRLPEATLAEAQTSKD